MKAFLKAGILSEDGFLRNTSTGTPQGGIVSPLLANIALSVLDDHFANAWQTMSATDYQRWKRRRAGLPNYRLVRFADDFVVLVHGSRADTEQLRDDVVRVLAPMGLRLSAAKTRSATSTRALTSWVSASSGGSNEAPPSVWSTPTRRRRHWLPSSGGSAR